MVGFQPPIPACPQRAMSRTRNERELEMVMAIVSVRRRAKVTRMGSRTGGGNGERVIDDEGRDGEDVNKVGSRCTGACTHT